MITALDEASLDRSHLRAVVASGVGFFTDAYDLFRHRDRLGAHHQGLEPAGSGEAGPAQQHHAGRRVPRAPWCSGAYADKVGRKRVYWLVAAIMIAGALGAALSQSFWMADRVPVRARGRRRRRLPGQRGHGTQDANRKDRGKLVGMVFGTQALGLIVGPLIALGPARLRRPGTSYGMARPARARRPARSSRGLPAQPDARITALPGPRAEPPRPRQASNAPAIATGVSDVRPGRWPGEALVVHRPALAGHAGRDGGLLVPARLRLLREHDLYAADP